MARIWDAGVVLHDDPNGEQREGRGFQDTLIPFWEIIETDSELSEGIFSVGSSAALADGDSAYLPMDEDAEMQRVFDQMLKDDPQTEWF